MESLVHRSVSGAIPETIFTLLEHSTAGTTESEADKYRLSLRCLDAEACISLGVNHRILLSWLIEFARLEVLYWCYTVEGWIEIPHKVIGTLRLEVFVEQERIV